MLQKVVVGLCCVRSHTLGTWSQNAFTKSVIVFLWQSLVPCLFPLYSFCSVFVYWGSSILWRGCCFSFIVTTQLNFSIFWVHLCLPPPKEYCMTHPVIVLLFLWIQVRTCASKFHCTALQQHAMFCKYFFCPCSVHVCFYYLSSHQYLSLVFLQSFLYCFESLLWLFFEFLLSVCNSFLFLPVIAGNPHVNPKCYVLSCSNHFGFITFVVYEAVCMRVSFYVLFWTRLFNLCVAFDLCIAVLLFLVVGVVVFCFLCCWVFCWPFVPWIRLLGSLFLVWGMVWALFVSLIFGLMFVLWIFVSCLSRHVFLLFLHLSCKLLLLWFCAVCFFLKLCDVRCFVFIQWKIALHTVRKRCISTGFRLM